MTKTDAKKIIDAAYSKVIDIAQSSMSQGTRREIEELVKAETKESRNPSFTQPTMRAQWAKAGIVGSILGGASNPDRNIGDLYGIRDAHVSALIIGARFAEAVNTLGIDASAIEEAKALTW